MFLWNNVIFWRPFWDSFYPNIWKSSLYTMGSSRRQIDRVLSENRPVFDVGKQWISIIFNDFCPFCTTLMDVVEGVPRTQGNDTMACKNCLGLRFQEKKTGWWYDEWKIYKSWVLLRWVKVRILAKVCIIRKSRLLCLPYMLRTALIVTNVTHHQPKTVRPLCHHLKDLLDPRDFTWRYRPDPRDVRGG